MNAPRAAISEDDLALDLGGLLREIGGAMRWLLPLVLFVTATVFVSLLFVAPKYKGEARLLIQSTDSQFPGGSRGVEGERAVLDSEGVASQVQLLLSGDLARRVVSQLDLPSHEEFRKYAGVSLVSKVLKLAGLSDGSGDGTVEERVLQHFYDNLEVFRLEGSRVIAVNYSSEDPRLSAAVANAIVDEYIALQSRAKRETTEQTSLALEPQIAELRREVQAARKAVEDFRARADLLVGTDNLTLNQRQLAEISSEYSAAQASKAEAQAKADLIRDLLKSGGSLETASDVLNSQLIQRLRERQVAIQSSIAELSITLLPNHPQLKALNSQLADYDRQIRSEARRILQGLENDAKVASQQAAALKSRLDELKIAAAKSNSDQVRLSELEREANAKASQLDQLLSSYREADSRLKAQVLPADARIISRASVPIEPYAPKIMSTTIIAALVTFILGCAFVIMRAFLSGRALQPVSGVQPAMAAPVAASAPPPPSDRPAPNTPDLGWPGGYGQPLSNYSMSSSTFDRADRSRDLPRTERSIFRSAARDADPDSVRPARRERPHLDSLRRARADRDKGKDRYDTDVAPDWLESEKPKRSAASRLADLKPSRRTERSERPERPSRRREEQTFDRAPETTREPEFEPTRRSARKVPRPELVREERHVAEVETADHLYASDVDTNGRIVVLSVDDEALSHDLAFDLARKAAKSGKSSVVMEVFPEQTNAKAAEGFSDIVAGTAAFGEVVYRDAASPAHIIESGRVEITDSMVNTERFKSALDAVRTTYDTVVVDLGAIDGSLASARMLSFADRVLIAASAPDHGHELSSAANLLSHNTGASVEVVIAGRNGPGPRRDGNGHAA